MLVFLLSDHVIVSQLYLLLIDSTTHSSNSSSIKVKTWSIHITPPRGRGEREREVQFVLVFLGHVVCPQFGQLDIWESLISRIHPMIETAQMFVQQHALMGWGWSLNYSPHRRDTSRCCPIPMWLRQHLLSPTLLRHCLDLYQCLPDGSCRFVHHLALFSAVLQGVGLLILRAI